MLNRSRQLDILLFKVDDAIVIEQMAISPEWNQLICIENTYYFKKN